MVPWVDLSRLSLGKRFHCFHFASPLVCVSLPGHMDSLCLKTEVDAHSCMLFSPGLTLSWDLPYSRIAAIVCLPHDTVNS